jgi:5-methylcytosine-specific restriction endonuclease McrA
MVGIAEAHAEHERREAAFSDRTRRAILERDNEQCTSCGLAGENRLHIHHLVYRSQGGTGEEENGITLCYDCHADVHAGLLTPAWVEWMPGMFGWFFRRLRPPRRWMRNVQ